MYLFKFTSKETTHPTYVAAPNVKEATARFFAANPSVQVFQVSGGTELVLVG